MILFTNRKSIGEKWVKLFGLSFTRAIECSRRSLSCFHSIITSLSSIPEEIYYYRMLLQWITHCEKRIQFQIWNWLMFSDGVAKRNSCKSHVTRMWEITDACWCLCVRVCVWEFRTDVWNRTQTINHSKRYFLTTKKIVRWRFSKAEALLGKYPLRYVNKITQIKHKLIPTSHRNVCAAWNNFIIVHLWHF